MKKPIKTKETDQARENWDVLTDEEIYFIERFRLLSPENQDLVYEELQKMARGEKNGIQFADMEMIDLNYGTQLT